MSSLSGPKTLGDRLLESGLITRTQLDAALEHQARATHRRSLGRTLVELGFVNDRDLSRALSIHLALPVLPFAVDDVTADAIAAIPSGVAHRHRALPCRIVGGALLIAAGSSLPAAALEELGRVSGRPVLLYLAAETEIDAALRKHYGDPPMDAARLRRLAARVHQIADRQYDGCLRAELEYVRTEIDALLSSLTHGPDDGRQCRECGETLHADAQCPHCISTGGLP
jgi:type IV pilus assembly protein PilB